MSVCVIGGGSLGLVYAGFLPEVSDCVLLTRRAEQAAAINEQGVTIQKGNRQRMARPLASSNPEAIADADIVLVLTKAYDADAAAHVVQEHSAPQALVVSLQSGLGALQLFNETCGSERVLGGISYLGAKRNSDVEVVLADNLRTVIGEQDGQQSERVRSIQALLNSAGFDAQISTSITKLTWDKMAIIVAQHALSALTGRTFGELRHLESATQTATALLDEFKTVAGSQGIEWDDDLLSRVHANWESLPGHRSSMWQDLQSGRPTEIDFINGAIARLGDENGIATPWNQMITSLVRTAEAKAF